MPYMKNGQNDRVFPWEGKGDEGDEFFNDTRYDFHRKHLYGKFFPHF